MKRQILLRIDNPEDRVIRKGIRVIRGWCACYDGSTVGGIQFHINGGQLQWRPDYRPDVTEAHPDKTVVGFRIDLDLNEHFHAVRGGRLTITFVPTAAPEMPLEFFVEQGLIGHCLAAAAGV